MAYTTEDLETEYDPDFFGYIPPPSKSYDLNRLLKWAREREVSLVLDYIEPEDRLVVEVISGERAERYTCKNVQSVERFIEDWTNHVEAEMGLKPSGRGYINQG